jgi:16S rRNA (cytosine1402-N4)-methyltransferase
VDVSAFHTPVLCREAIDFLCVDPAGTYVEGTVGGGGHAEEICKRLHGAGRLLCFDLDDEALRHAGARLARYSGRIEFIHANVRYLRTELRARHIEQIHGLLLDCGVSSYQLDLPSRGFSFRADERLDMRMNQSQLLSAWDVVNSSPEEQLQDILWQFGEERYARRIARRMVERRPIDTSGQLAAVVESVVGGRYVTKSLARVFQAIRIHVNDELESLRQTLTETMDILNPGGRIVVIDYHSLEDRIVKEAFRSEAADRIPSGHALVPDTMRNPRLRILTKKPLLPSPEECHMNHRARSAKMRVAERTSAQ